MQNVYNQWRRGLAGLLARMVGADGERIWSHVDMEHPAAGPWELVVTRRIKRMRWLMTLASLMLFVVGAWVVWWLMPSLMLGMWQWIASALVAGIAVHGLFILIVHEAAHGNLFGRRGDRWLGAIACGVLLLPFAAASYSQLHRRHHACTNRNGDNNWTSLRRRLYQRSRLLYMLYELIPVVNNLDRITSTSNISSDRSAAALAWGVAALVWWWSGTTIAWYAFVLVGLTAVNALRLWVEHMGSTSGRVANTYGGCPLGFGIGHHALHHLHPGIPAPVLMVGLWLRQHDVTLWSGWWRLLFDRRWRHFSDMAD